MEKIKIGELDTLYEIKSIQPVSTNVLQVIFDSAVREHGEIYTLHTEEGTEATTLIGYDTVYWDEWFVVDDNIITSSCPKTAPEVAFQLLEMLTSKEKAAQVREAMGY